MTSMRRVTISFDDHTEKAVEAVRASSEKPCSFSEAVRRLILRGYQELSAKENPSA